MEKKATESVNRVIKMDIDGVAVEGWIGGNARNITVWITEPYVDMCHALHCPWFDPRLFIGAHREKTARTMLTNLYGVGLFLDQNYKALGAFYRWYCVNWKPDFRHSAEYQSILSGTDDTFGEVVRYLKGSLHGLARLRVALKIAFKVNTGLWKAELNSAFMNEVLPEDLKLPYWGEFSIPRMLTGRRDLLSKNRKG